MKSDMHLGIDAGGANLKAGLVDALWELALRTVREAALLLQPLRWMVAAECISRHGGVYTEIVRAELGNDAGIIGAAMLHRAVR